MSREEYFSSPRINNSLLNLIAENPKSVKFKRDNPGLESIDTKAFRIGGGLDCLVTTPEEF